ncbi:hypothetical protein BVX97_05215 [bacterium E08(2017)]|nr:hypothetical protein BVX97_05215 [bacterium E08(2017)]
MQANAVLITGASGLLGSAIAKRLSSICTVIPLSHSNTASGMQAVDLRDNQQIESLDDLDWDLIIHCAAFRDPDFCETNKDAARQLNALVPQALANMANKRKARMVHISTDYVFDGKNAPYSEDSTPAPINVYGITKLEAEQLVSAACPDSTIVRIPVLYGDSPSTTPSPFLDKVINSLKAKTPFEMDNHTVRRPTCTADVAEAIAFLIDSDFNGTIHASAQEKATNYTWAKYVAELIGADSSLVSPMADPIRRAAPRPDDSTLLSDLLKEIGGPAPRPFSEALPSLKKITNMQ